MHRKSLTEMNKQIFEFKKKIQLSEGQRKAHYEELDGEKKRNNDKIKQLKKEIKNLNGQLSTSGENVDSVLKASTKYPKEMGALRNKTGDDIIVILDCRVTDLKKKLDQLHHESHKSQRRMKELADEYHSLLHRKTVHCKDMECLEICTLENQIHRVEMNLMEAEHIKKKYRIIQSNLLEDSVAFESTLMKIEEAIQKQESEMMHLKAIYGEALGLRDSTRGILLRQEVSAVNMARIREKQLEDLRFQVDERRQELERLERHIFPTARTLMHQDSASSTEGAPSTMDDSTAKITIYLEKAFEKLKAATGEMDAEDVLKRFLSQKETLSRLSYLRSIAEKEKQELQRQKDILVTELEALKFAEVKGNEQNAEESEKLKQQIHVEDNRRQRLDTEVQILRERLRVIGSIMCSFCEKLQDASGIALPVESEDIMETLERQLRSVLDRTEQGAKLDRTVQQMQEERSGRLKLPVQVVTEAADSRTPAALPASETEEEDEVPTRGFLKRQAQIIVDAKSRHKQFPMAARGRKTLTLK
ncbi:hypothetical protein Cfor_09945 [Coptotermes formosanus]|uniref:Uncharacterized protein n=1 Tax=Coptotermes formosanus TaxID=36987 RepID=A0A6L2PIP2_COPFO|nr:hypothetical protein Cfor_09945 [Coptotermes formosanus]